jgi:hypothetical protein
MKPVNLFRRRPQTNKQRRASARPQVERLEDRSLLSRMPMVSGAVDFALSGQGPFGQITPGDFKNPTSPIGANPYSLAANVNTDTPGDGGAESSPHNETTIAVNPTNPLNMIVSANDYQAVMTDGGQVKVTLLSRAHVTFDGGHTWTEYPIPFKGYNFTGDPAISFDANGTAYLETLGLVNPSTSTGKAGTNSIDLVVSHSSDGGQTWSDPVPVATGKGASGARETNDKPYLAAWGNGNAIVTWTQLNFGAPGVFENAPVLASVTHDGGNTWTNPVQISGNLLLGDWAVPTVAADGSIYVSFFSADRETAPYFRDEYEVVKVDPNNGQALSQPVDVSLVYGSFLTTGGLGSGNADYPLNVNGRPTYQDSQFRTGPGGNMTADPTYASHLAVVWSDMRDNPYPNAVLPSLDPYQVQTNSDIIISQSFDGGQTWSAPTAIQEPGDQFQPWAAYNSVGLLQIGYCDRSYDPANHQYGYTLASETAPGSLNFIFHQASTALSDPTQGSAFHFTTANSNFPNAANFIGDYSGIANFSPTLVAASWTDMRLQSTFAPPFTGSSEDAFFALVDPPLPPTMEGTAAGLSGSGLPSRSVADISTRDAFFALVGALSPDAVPVAHGQQSPTIQIGAISAPAGQSAAPMDLSGGPVPGSSVKQLTPVEAVDAGDTVVTDDPDADDSAGLALGEIGW